MKPLIPLFFFVLLFTACNQESSTSEMAAEPKRDTVDYRAVIEETNKAFATAALNGDSATLASELYHPEAKIFAPNEPMMDSKKTASLMGQFPKMGLKTFTLSTTEIFEGDETVTEVGTFAMGDGNKEIDKGKYMVVWKKDGDKWKLYRDIWNSDNEYIPHPQPAKK